MEKSFTEIVREQTTPYWEGSFKHPFIIQLQEGSLPIENFRYYLIQDSYYLIHGFESISWTNFSRDGYAISSLDRSSNSCGVR